MKHHIVSEPDQRVRCIYCNDDKHLRLWKSEFESEIHYKVFLCDCGARTRIRMKFMGSGHDTWGGQLPKEVKEMKASGKITVLENIVSKVQEQLKKK